jgi:hypothetical protein
VERGIENGDVGNIGKNGADGLYSGDIGWIVQRGEMLDRFNGIDDIIVDQHRPGEFLTAMHHAVPDGGNLVYIFEHPMLGVS